MAIRLLMAALLGGVAAISFCQTPVSAGPVPDYIIYDIFFTRVMWLDEVGAQIAAEGHDASAARATVRKQAGLSIGEEATLKQVAAKWREQSDSISKSARALSGGRATDAQGLPQLQSRRRQMVLDLVDELKRSLGPARFARLDAYIRVTTRVRPPTVRGISAGGAR